jgi:predicted DsbA family dithiol-disulfide isomerase
MSASPAIAPQPTPRIHLPVTVMKVEIYSDISCPWCYIGEKRFAAALASFEETDVAVSFRPFQLDPDASSVPRPLIDALREKFGTNVQPMLDRVSGAAAGEGIEMQWGRAVAVNTITAHRLLRLALEEYGAATQRQLAEQLFDAHFTRGADVGDHALLTKLARDVGMNAERVRHYLESDEGLAETRAEIGRAQALGIRAVPTFVFDDQYVVEGGQPSAVFADVLREVAALSAGQRESTVPE